MNVRSTISFAVVGAVSTIVALAFARECPSNDPLEPRGLTRQEDPSSCSLGAVKADAFAFIDATSTRLACNMKGDGAAFADTFGYKQDGSRAPFCQAIDTDPSPDVFGVEDDPSDCVDVVFQDLAITD